MHDFEIGKYLRYLAIAIFFLEKNDAFNKSIDRSDFQMRYFIS